MNTSNSDRSGALPWLASIRYRRLRFFYRAASNGSIDYFPGPEIRNAVGPILKEFCGCTGHLEEDCSICPPERKRRCLYAGFYDHRNSAPKGWVLRLEPASRSMRSFVEAGDTLAFDLILLGAAAEKALPLIRGVLANHIRLSGRVKFELVEAGFVDTRGGFVPLAAGDAFPMTALADASDDGLKAVRPGDAVELMIQTPTEVHDRYMNGKKIYLRDPAAFTCRLFVMRMLQRTEEIARLFHGWDGEGREGMAARRLMELAESVSVHPDPRAGWKKVALRTHPERMTGGLLGRFVFEGDLVPFLPLFEAASRLGLGRKTALGYGQVSYRPLPEWLPSGEGVLRAER